MKPDFEWDRHKTKANFKKHRISFDEATTIFADPLLVTFPDPLHSHAEERYLSIGVSRTGRVLIVAHVDRHNKIRLVSCRKATASERRRYEENENEKE